MKQTREYIEELLTKFLLGETSEAEEQTLKEFFCSEADIPAEWTEYKEMFQSFNSDAYGFSNEEIDAMLTPAPKKKPSIVHLLAWASAACVAAIGAIIWLMTLNPDKPTDSPTVAEVKPTGSVMYADSVVALPECRDAIETMYVPAKAQKVRKAKAVKRETPKVQELSTAELIETVHILAEVCSEDFTLTTASDDEGYHVKVSSGTGMTNCYRLRRCADGSSIEMTSKNINF